VHAALAGCLVAAGLVAVLALIHALRLILATVPDAIKLATVGDTGGGCLYECMCGGRSEGGWRGCMLGWVGTSGAWVWILSPSLNTTAAACHVMCLLMVWERP
jgi:hypothetical protein